MKSHKGAMPKLNPFVLADLAQGLARFERLAKRVDLERPWLTQGGRSPRRADLGDLDPAQPAHGTGREYFNTVGEGVWAAQPADMSLLHALFYTHSNADLETLISTDQRRPAGSGRRRVVLRRRGDRRGAGRAGAAGRRGPTDHARR